MVDVVGAVLAATHGKANNNHNHNHNNTNGNHIDTVVDLKTIVLEDDEGKIKGCLCDDDA